MLILIGNGGHARSCRDVLAGRADPLRFFSDLDDGDPLRIGSFADIWKFSTSSLHLAIGPSKARIRLAESLKLTGERWFSIVSPLAVLRSDRIGDGVFIGHSAYIGPGTQIGSLAIVNTAAIVEHDCIVEEGAFIGPGAVLCGAVTVGANAMIGAGAVVIDKMKIEAGARIPAGATVR
jgi:sugar O-acyltransferase (sialic acid O-acetyltransferase NeuD family)